jgi:hypothetical protein
VGFLAGRRLVYKAGQTHMHLEDVLAPAIPVVYAGALYVVYTLAQA